MGRRDQGDKFQNKAKGPEANVQSLARSAKAAVAEVQEALLREWRRQTCSASSQLRPTPKLSGPGL